MNIEAPQELYLEKLTPEILVDKIYIDMREILAEEPEEKRIAGQRSWVYTLIDHGDLGRAQTFMEETQVKIRNRSLSRARLLSPVLTPSQQEQELRLFLSQSIENDFPDIESMENYFRKFPDIFTAPHIACSVKRRAALSILHFTTGERDWWREYAFPEVFPLQVSDTTLVKRIYRDAKEIYDKYKHVQPKFLALLASYALELDLYDEAQVYIDALSKTGRDSQALFAISQNRKQKNDQTVDIFDLVHQKAQKKQIDEELLPQIVTQLLDRGRLEEAETLVNQYRWSNLQILMHTAWAKHLYTNDLPYEAHYKKAKRKLWEIMGWRGVSPDLTLPLTTELLQFPGTPIKDKKWLINLEIDHALSYGGLAIQYVCKVAKAVEAADMPSLDIYERGIRRVKKDRWAMSSQLLEIYESAPDNYKMNLLRQIILDIHPEDTYRLACINARNGQTKQAQWNFMTLAYERLALISDPSSRAHALERVYGTLRHCFPVTQ